MQRVELIPIDIGFKRCVRRLTQVTCDGYRQPMNNADSMESSCAEKPIRVHQLRRLVCSGEAWIEIETKTFFGPGYNGKCYYEFRAELKCKYKGSE